MSRDLAEVCQIIVGLAVPFSVAVVTAIVVYSTFVPLGAVDTNSSNSYDSRYDIVERLDLPVNVTRVTNPDRLIFIYECRGDEQGLLYIIDNKKKEFRSPKGNIGMYYQEYKPYTKSFGGQVSYMPMASGDFGMMYSGPTGVEVIHPPDAQLIVSRINGTAESYVLPIAGGSK